MSEYVNSGEGSHSERGRLLGGALLYTGMRRASCPQPYVKALLFLCAKGPKTMCSGPFYLKQLGIQQLDDEDLFKIVFLGN